MNAVELATPFLAEIHDRAADVEAARQMPADLAERMAGTGLFRMLVPRVYGGLQVHPQAFFDTLASVSEADGAVGWCLMIGNTTGLLSASLPPEWAQEIYASAPDNITVGVTAPLGRAELVEGGLRVTGRWPFGSGGQVAQWICGGCFVMENGKPRVDKRGAREALLVFFRRDEVEIHDTWDTSGLRGTGSHDFSVTDGFVPTGRWVTLGKRALVDAPLYRFPTLGLLALGVSAVSSGIAAHAIQTFTQLATQKVPSGSRRSLAARSIVQKDLAQAQASLRSARAFTREVIEAAWQQANNEGRISTPLKADLRLAATNNTWTSVAAVDALYHAAGGTSIYASNDLQRCFRDVHVTTQHLMVAQPTLEVVGKVMLGIDPKTML